MKSWHLNRLNLTVLALSALFAARGASADVFNMPAGQTSLDFVTVGDPGNASNPTTGFGAVNYTYSIGEYDVTAAQYTQFLNAVAKSDPYSLYNSAMAPVPATSGNIGSGITRSGSTGSYTYTVSSFTQNSPVDNVDWGDAARFINWLDNGQPTGAEVAGTTETGAYTLNGATSATALANITRNAGEQYVLPSENEWYKAAYYKGGSTNAGYWLYPTQSNTQPSNVLSATGTNNANYYNDGYTDPTNLLTPVGYFAGSPGPYGTYDMAGEVFNWDDAIFPSTGNRGMRGSSYNPDDIADRMRSDNTPSNDWSMTPTDINGSVGFRVVAVPEPASLAVLALGILGISLRRRK